jgi:hypothetical protein
MPVPAPLREKIFGVNFKPVDRRPLLEERAIVRSTQADTNAVHLAAARHAWPS